MITVLSRIKIKRKFDKSLIRKSYSRLKNLNIQVIRNIDKAIADNDENDRKRYMPSLQQLPSQVRQKENIKTNIELKLNAIHIYHA